MAVQILDLSRGVSKEEHNIGAEAVPEKKKPVNRGCSSNEVNPEVTLIMVPLKPLQSVRIHENQNGFRSSRWGYKKLPLR